MSDEKKEQSQEVVEVDIEVANWHVQANAIPAAAQFLQNVKVEAQAEDYKPGDVIVRQSFFTPEERAQAEERYRASELPPEIAIVLPLAVHSRLGLCAWLARRLDATKPGVGQYCAPGGGIAPGESPRDAAVREVAEETRLVISPEALVECGVLRVRWREGKNVLAHLFIVELPDDVEPDDVPGERNKLGAWTPMPLDHARRFAPLTPGTAALIHLAEAWRGGEPKKDR